MAEHQAGITKGIGDVVLVNIALGIGGSLIFDGHLVRGQAHAAGRIGHIKMPGSKELCKCGRSGCLDTLASGQAILARLNVLPKNQVSKENKAGDAELLKSLIKKIDDNDANTIRAFYQAGKQLGFALNTVSAIIDPDAFLLSGPVAHTEPYFEGVKKTINLSRLNGNNISLLISNMTRDGAAISLALDEFIFSHEIPIDFLKKARR